LNSRL